MHGDRQPPALTTPSSVRSDHVLACAAYVVGWPVIEVIITSFGLYDFIVASYDLSGYTMIDHLVLSQRLPDRLSYDQELILNVCHLSPVCAVSTLAQTFTALAIVGMGVVPKLIDGATFAAPVQGPSKFLHFLHFVACLALVVFVGRYIVWPLLSVVFGGGIELSYGEKWKFVPLSMLVGHLGEFVAACLATRHSIRIRGGWQAPSPFFATVLAGDAQAVAEHLSSGVDPNAVRHDDGATALHVAARAGQPDVVATLLANGATATVRDHASATPLHLAAAAGDVAAINALLDAGADPHAYDGDARLSLSYAEENAHPQATAALRARMDQIGGEDQ